LLPLPLLLLLPAAAAVWAPSRALRLPLLRTPRPSSWLRRL
jgi:hypothetical protein